MRRLRSSACWRWRSVWCSSRIASTRHRLYTTKFWPFASEVEVATLWLILATSVGSIVVFWVCTKLRRVFSELRELRLQRDQRRLLDEQRRRQEELNAQEKRIDEKLRNAAGPQGSERGG